MRQVPLEDQSVDKAYQKLVELNLIPSTPRARGVANKIATIVDHLSGGPEEASANFIASMGWTDPHGMMRFTGRTDVKFWEFLWETYRDLGGNQAPDGSIADADYAGYPPYYWRKAPKYLQQDPSADDRHPSEPGPCEQISKFRSKREMQQECMRLKKRDPSLNCGYGNLSNSLCAFYSTNS